MGSGGPSLGRRITPRYEYVISCFRLEEMLRQIEQKHRVALEGGTLTMKFFSLPEMMPMTSKRKWAYAKFDPE